MIPIALSRYHLEMIAEAELTASFSKDPSTKVGAVACKNKRILAKGRNGYPAGVPDIRYDSRDFKMLLVVHSEANLIAHAAAAGHSLEGADMFVTFPICNDCAKLVMGAGVTNVFVPLYEKRDEWFYRWKLSVAMLNQVKIAAYEYDKELGDMQMATNVGIDTAVYDLMNFLKEKNK